MSSLYVLLAMVILLSLVFSYSNGFQDGSTVAASAIASKSLSKRQAVLLVAAFEFLGAILGGSAVAHSIQGITSYPSRPDMLPILASGLTGAIMWNFITRRLGLPSSSTHALVGGVIGSVIAASDSLEYVVFGHPGGIVSPTGLWRVGLSLFLSPIVGFALGYIALRVLVIVLKNASSALNVRLKQLQWLAVPLLAFGHGANDCQKAMGLVTMALCAAGVEKSAVIPDWVRLLTGLAMVLGVVSLVPRIVYRVGGIYKLRPLHGFVAESTSAAIVTFASLTGGPLAASQVIASTVTGVGTAERKSGVQWLVVFDMIRAWGMTIPCSGALSWALYTLMFHQLNYWIKQ